jgi:hypothetical protein
MNLSELKAQAGLESWHFEFDNPTILGWSVVAFYGIAALSCAVAAMPARSRRGLDPKRGQRAGSAGIWWALALALTFLGVNKQLNLQTLLIVVMRHLSVVGGWWGHRRAVQLVFGLVFGSGVGLLLMWLASRHRDFFQKNRQVFWGVIILGVFVSLRAATINHTDEFLRINLEDEYWAWVLEISGSVLIGIGAMQARLPSGA